MRAGARQHERRVHQVYDANEPSRVSWRLAVRECRRVADATFRHNREFCCLHALRMLMCGMLASPELLCRLAKCAEPSSGRSSGFGGLGGRLRRRAEVADFHASARPLCKEAENAK